MGKKVFKENMLFNIDDERLNKIYSMIVNPRKKYGDYKKCEFHIHTPASNCYRFKEYKAKQDEDMEGKYRYEDLTIEEVIEYCQECGYLSDDKVNELIENLEWYESTKYIEELKMKKIPFNSLKEYLVYMAIAYKLNKEHIEVAVISDHNTVKGYNKLQFALNQYHDENFGRKSDVTRVELILGVEISCSDRNHLMVIYDANEIMILQKYLSEIIMDEKLGTYFDTRKVIEDLEKYKAITYISHINTSKLFGTGVYKKALFYRKGFIGFGVSNLDTIEREKDRIKNFKSDVENLAVIYEGDSHCINEIGKKNCWVKLSKVNFKSMSKAFLNHNICICNKKPEKTSKYIRGMVIDPGRYGFLRRSKDSSELNLLALNFSSDLNCIIGGRGTGKSTILNILEIIFSQQTDNLKILDFISKHKSIYIVFEVNDKEYLMEFICQSSYRYSYNEQPQLLKRAYTKEKKANGDIYYKLKPHWYNVYEVKNLGLKNTYKQVNEYHVPYILKDVFRRGYNINKLVNKISSDNIGDYIAEVVTYGIDYEDISSYIRELQGQNNLKFQKYLREHLNKIISMINERKKKFAIVTDKFNSENSSILRIEYSPISRVDVYFDLFLRIFDISEHSYASQYVGNTYLTWYEVQNYFEQLIKRVNYFELLDMLLNKKYSKMEKFIDISSVHDKDITYKEVNKGLNEITSENIKNIYTDIFNRVKKNRLLLEESIIKCFKVLDKFNIEFNINNKEDVVSPQNIFKRVEELSLGQQVAALLTFVFKFGIIANDNTPLLIDQPEDNLDNTYIYRTLVDSLKAIKNNRQVVIVTHSSTIVTNADAEEVIVMNSINNRGWVEKSGYPSEPVITRHIINYLEGGEESFKHKMNTYNTIIGN